MSGKISLFVNIYTSLVEARNAELRACIKHNLANAAIDTVFCYVDDSGEELYKEFANDPCLQRIDTSKRPTFRQIFKDIVDLQAGSNAESLAQNLYIVANADIVFAEKDLQRAQELGIPHIDECWALARWNIPGIDRLEDADAFDVDYSQDTWILRGRFNEKFFTEHAVGNFHMGVPGCDNRIAYDLSLYYNVLNPCKSFHAYHYHSIDGRTYTEQQRLGGPYKNTPNVAIKDF